MAEFTGTSSLHSGSYIGKLTVTETSVNRENNSSTLTWTLEMNSTNGYYYRGFGTEVSVKIDGVEVAPSSNVTVYMTPNYSASNHYYTFWSGKTTVVGHDTDGTKTVSCAVRIYRPETTVSGTRTNYLPGEISFSGQMALTNIVRTSSLNIPTLTLNATDSTYTIGVVKEKASYTDTITYEIFSGSQKVTGTCLSNSTATSFQFSVPASWISKSAFNSSPSVTGKFTVTTVKDSGTLTGDIPFTVNLARSFAPNQPTVTATPYPASMPAYATDKTAVKLACSSSMPSGSGNATIAKFVITGAEEGEATATNGSANYTTQKFATTGSKSFNVVAVDSRGNTSDAQTVSVTYQKYTAPTINQMTLERGTVEGGEFTPSIAGAAIRVTLLAKTSLNANGTFTVVCKEAGSSSAYATKTLASKTGSVVFDTTSDNVEYSIEATFRDDYGGTASRTDTMPKVNIPINILPSDNSPGVSFGGMSFGGYTVTFNEPWKFYLPEVTGDVGTVVSNLQSGSLSNWVKPIYPAVCETAGGTQRKDVGTNDRTIKLQQGMMVAILFLHANTASNPTLKVNDFAAKTITRYTNWQDGEVVIFFYYNNNWVAVGSNGVSSYEDLTNKPTLNSKTIDGDHTADYYGLANLSDLPTQLSELSDDSTHRLVTDAEKATWDSKLPGNTLYAAAPVQAGNAVQTNAILFGDVDSGSTSTAYAATVTGLTGYYDGVTIMLKNGIVSSGGSFTINVNGLGAKTVVSNMTLNNNPGDIVFSNGTSMLFVYDSRLRTGGCWIAYKGSYVDTDELGYRLRTNSSRRLVTDQTGAYRLLFSSADGSKWVPANTGSDASATTVKTICQTPIDPFGEIRYYSGNSVIASGSATGTDNVWEQEKLYLGYSFNDVGQPLQLTSPAPVYVKCSKLTESETNMRRGAAVLEGIVQTLPLYQAEPPEADDNIYIYLGMAISATEIELVPYHPVYYYSHGALHLWTNLDMDGIMLEVYSTYINDIDADLNGINDSLTLHSEKIDDIQESYVDADGVSHILAEGHYATTADIQTSADGIVTRFSKVEETVNGETGLVTQVSNLNKVITLDANGVTVASENSNIKGVFGDSSLDFLDASNTRQAWIDTDEDGLGAKQLSLGDPDVPGNRWRIFTSADGNHLRMTRHT